MSVSDSSGVVDVLLRAVRNDDLMLRALIKHYLRAEEAKQLMRDAGAGVLGQDILETTRELLEQRH